MKRQVKLNQNETTFIQVIWLIGLVLLVGCISEDGINLDIPKENVSADASIVDDKTPVMHTYWEEIKPGHDFSKLRTVTLYLLENPPHSGEIVEVYLISNDRSKQSKFRVPGTGKDKVSNYSISMIPNTFKEGPPCMQISLISGPGERYDEILTLIRK